MSKHFITLAVAVMFLVAANAKADWALSGSNNFAGQEALFGFTVDEGKVGTTFFGLVPVLGTVTTDIWPDDVTAIGGSDWGVKVTAGDLLAGVTGFSISWDGGVLNSTSVLLQQMTINGKQANGAGEWYNWFAPVANGLFDNTVYFAMSDLTGDSFKIGFNALTWIESAPGGYTFTFYGTGAGGNGGGGDTPEPATLAVLGLGLAGLGIARRRMKK